MGHAWRKAIATMHRRGWSAAGLAPEIVADPGVTPLVEATAAVLDAPLESTSMSPKMIDALRRSNYVFSGLKTFHSLNEAFPSMVDGEGALKPFKQFLSDVQSIDSTYNKHYLRAEYNFAISSAQSAARWEQIEADGDRYDLQYRTAGDNKVRPEHAALHGVTLPPSSPFWDSFMPPNGWNCRCTAVQVRKGKYPQTDVAEAMERGEVATADDKRGMMRFNPGKERSVWPAYNPYTTTRCRDCDIAKGKGTFAHTPPPANEVCNACSIIRQMKANAAKRRLDKQERNDIKAATEQWVTKHLPTEILPNGDTAYRMYLKSENGDKIRIGKEFYEETFSKNLYNRSLAETMLAAMEIAQWLPSAKYIRTESGRHHDFPFKVYEAYYNGQKIELKAKVTDGIISYNLRLIK